MKSGDECLVRNSFGEDKVYIYSGNSGYNVTVKDEYGRMLEFPVGQVKPINIDMKEENHGKA